MNELRAITNAIANAGIRVRRNIWNLYIHLCWQTVEQQFNPALAIASAVSGKQKKPITMRFIIIIFTLLFLPRSIYSQSQIIKSNNDFIDNIIEIVMEKGQDTFVEFPELYEKLSKGIPEDQDEKLLLVENLKNKGFIVIDWGRGNYLPLGPRIITVSLTNNNCDCQVVKIYYSTVIEDEFIMTEKIKCKKAYR